MKRDFRTVLAGGVAAVALLGASPAFAITGTYKGAYAYTHGKNLDHITAKDIKADGHDAMAEYFERPVDSFKYRVVTSGGNGSTKTRVAGDLIRSMRVCLEKSLAPDECGSWR